MAAVSLLLQFNPVKRNHHHRSNSILLYAACKSRIELSKRRIPIKCILSSKNQHPPVYDDDVSKNRFLDLIFDLRTDELMLNWKFYALHTFSVLMYRGPMPGEVLLVFTILLCLTWLAALASMVSAVEVPRMIHENTTCVIKLQVGLLGMGCSLIQKKLHHIAQAVDASNLEGLNHVSTELSMAFLRHIDYCISGYSSVDVTMSPTEWKKRFELLSIEERGKLNVKNIWTPSSFYHNYEGFDNEHTVVTILVAVKGLHKLPSINRSADLKEALLTIASIIARETLAVEVFWTPRNENDMLWEQTFLKDYPLLKKL